MSNPYKEVDPEIEDITVPFSDLPSDELPEDFDTPERGLFLPRIAPRTVVQFRFEPTEVREGTMKDGRRVLNLIYTAIIPVSEVPPGRLIREVDQSEIEIRFNEVSNFRFKDEESGKSISPAGILFRSLQLHEEFPGATPSQVIDILRQTTGRYARGVIGWKAHTKLADGTYERYSTHPRKKQGDLPWPKGDPTEIIFSNKEKRAGREFIVRALKQKSEK